MSMALYQKRIEATYLSHCTSQAAYDWLADHQSPPGELASLFEDHPTVLEYLLLRRKDPLIDLGLARFARSSSIIRRVYRRGGVGVRCAALSNSNVGPNLFTFLGQGWLNGSGLKDLVEIGTEAELEALVKNPSITDEAVERLLTRGQEFAEISDIRFLKALVWLGENPRISKPYDRRHLDGYAEYSHNNIFNLVWELARSLPTDKDHAAVLCRLLDKAQRPVRFEKIQQVIERWQIESLEEGQEKLFSYPFALRSRIADLLDPDDELLQSKDPALRRSFYRRFSPARYGNWPRFIENDGEECFDSLVENDNLWKTYDLRVQLQEAAWQVPDPHHGMMAPNAFNAVEERMRQNHPDWFRDEDDKGGLE